jgi:hypothetical protein
MKKIILLLTFVFCAALVTHSQSAEWKSVFSEEFYFWAKFPDEPRYTENDVDTRFGKSHSRRWTLETAEGIFYEVSVDDFSDLFVEMNYKSLKSFYDLVFADFAAQYSVKCDNYHTLDMFGEYGKHAGGRGRDVFVSTEMYLARKRLYMLKLVMPTVFERDRQKLLDARKFFDDFVFIHKKEHEKSYRYGLPESASQNYKFQ